MARKRKRDYAAEYKRRIERAAKKKIPRDVARGHAPKGKAGIKAARFLGIRPGEPLRAIDPELFSNWEKIREQVARDARRVFGQKPKRGSAGDEDFAAEYELRLNELIEERGNKQGRFSWEDERRFVGEMRAMGATERQAYTFWFSP